MRKQLHELCIIIYSRVAEIDLGRAEEGAGYEVY